jgi:hypothetical protein
MMIIIKSKQLKSIIYAAPLLTLIAGCSPKIAVVTDNGAGKDSLMVAKPINVHKDDTISGVEYFKEDYFRYDNHLYSGNIRSIQLYREGWEFAIPLITLGTEEKLNLTFDDLDGSVKNYKYTLIHCSASWKPTDLIPAEYLNGLTEDFINDHDFSFNTLQAYTHYKLTFPSDNVRPLLSGNYILKVFLDDAERTMIFTRKLMIMEPKVLVNMLVKRATSIDYHNYKQEVDFTIDRSGYLIDNPYVDMKVILMQNGRWDNARYDMKPRFVRDNIFDYDYEEENVFSGGNEFRHFDIKSLRWNSDRILNIYSDSAGEHVILRDDERVTFKNYYSEKDIDGRYLIKSEDNVRNSDVEAEYVWVHFFLKYESPLIDGSLYVFGALSDWQFLKENQMKYDYSRKGYECVLFLKQGYYNYQYVFLENGKTVGDESLVEGMHFETENQYTVLVYNREKGTMYDKLVGVQQTNTYTNK